MNFGEALEEIKYGKVATRTGWNGKGMFVYLNLGRMAPIQVSPTHGAIPPQLIKAIQTRLFTMGAPDTITRMPNLYLRYPDGSISTWVPSITDCLAEDWHVIEKSDPTAYYVKD
jgi:hypothetical protein